MSPTAKRLLAAVVVCGVAAVAAVGAIYARSMRSIAAAKTDGTFVRGEPLTQPAAVSTGRHLRAVVIGGMTFTGFWADLSKRYEQQTGVHVDVVATGEKNDIAAVFKKGGVDLITMHASDTVINLVADGYAVDPQPWMRNDLILVGPPDDPAKIKGMTDAAAALKKIAATKSPFVVPASLGAHEVLVNILGPGQIALDPSATTELFADSDKTVLKVAFERHAYTIVGRIPFRVGRIPNPGMELMVQDDLRLRRPYIVAVANPAAVPASHYADAGRFARYLRSGETQRWIADYGRGLIDDRPLFFPVDSSKSASRS